MVVKVLVFLLVAFLCGAYVHGLVLIDEPQDDSCDFPANILAEMRETKAKISSLVARLKTYATENGLTIPVDPAPTTETTPTTSTTISTTISTTTTISQGPIFFKNCKDILQFGYTSSGVYEIIVEGFTSPVQVYCDLTTDLGGWTVIQRRQDGTVDFNRTYAEYAEGFGELFGEFWMGNDLISALTQSDTMELRIDMTDFDDVTVFAKYGNFWVDGANKSYRLDIGGEFEGDAGNSLSYHQKTPFSTIDVDNDASPGRNCALRHNGGWWFKNCMRANLNGFYFTTGPHESYADGIEWSRFRGLKYSLKFTEMKIRPVTLTD